MSGRQSVSNQGPFHCTYWGVTFKHSILSSARTEKRICLGPQLVWKQGRTENLLPMQESNSDFSVVQQFLEQSLHLLSYPSHLASKKNVNSTVYQQAVHFHINTSWPLASVRCKIYKWVSCTSTPHIRLHSTHRNNINFYSFIILYFFLEFTLDSGGGGICLMKQICNQTQKLTQTVQNTLSLENNEKWKEETKKPKKKKKQKLHTDR